MKFAIIGFGEYAQEQHLPSIRRHGTLVAVVDLAKYEKLCRTLCPEATFIAADAKSPEQIANELSKHIDACIVSTSPDVRKQYVLALLDKHIPVYADKPLTFPSKATEDIAAARRIWRDYCDIVACAEQNKTLVWLHAQHRHDLNLKLIQREAAMTGTNVHYLELVKADGQQRLPREMDRKCHHGYVDEGILAHSAYHYIDFAMQVLSKQEYDTITIDTAATHAQDMAQVLYDDLTKATGETDAYITLQAKRHGIVVCTVTIAQLHTGVSARNRETEVKNWTRQSGRIKQEHIIAHLGHEATIRCERIYAPHNTGQGKHIRTMCEIFRNPRWRRCTYERIKNADEKGELAEKPRDYDFDQFIRAFNGENIHDNIIQTHAASVKVYSTICESLARMRNKLSSAITIPFNEHITGRRDQ